MVLMQSQGFTIFKKHAMVSSLGRLFISDLIVSDNAAFGYDGHIVVRGLNFTVQHGDYFCIAGENGSGKSTLVQGMLRLLKPMQGSISFNIKTGNKTIGYLSQAQALKKDFPAGVKEIVLSGNLGSMGLRPFYSRTEKQKALENMERLGISDLKDVCFRELSGGLMRRVLLARSLCAAKDALILDEPFAGLDPLASESLYLLLQKLNSESGITVIMVSHDIENAAKYAKHVLHLKNRQVFFGPVEDYKKSEFGKKFLDLPAKKGKGEE
jgi:zinc transport system ATP-binding protein